MLAPELAALFVVMASVLLLVFAILGSALHLGLTARTEHIARSIGGGCLGNARRCCQVFRWEEGLFGPIEAASDRL